MKLPTAEDFTGIPNPECGDAFCAWKNFGGLTIDEAYQKFCEFPDCSQEDFMFMGDNAFIFYFPVIDRYVREQEPEYEFFGKKYPFDGVTHFLAHSIDMHVSETSPSVRSLYNQIVKLCDFVLRSVADVPSEKGRSWSPDEIRTVWTELRKKALS